MVRFKNALCAVAVGSLCVFSPAEAAELVQNDSVFANVSQDEISNYASSLSTTMLGEKWEGRKSVDVSGKETDSIDWVNGITMGASTLMTWSEAGDSWFGRTESDGKLFRDEHGNYLRDVVITGSFEGKNATALTSARTTASATHRETNGSINFKADRVSLNGSFSGSGDVANGTRKTNWTMKLSGAGRTVDVVYTVRDENVSGHYFAVDVVGEETYDGAFAYISDEPNFVRDVDFILRNMR